MKTFNKKGDRGETSLLFGQRVPKNDLRCEAYGALDEAVSALGLARNFVTRENVKEIILKVQNELFTVNAEIATRPEEREKLTAHFKTVTPEMVDELEELIVRTEAEVELPRSFIIPGSTTGSAALDLSRAIVRRAERKVVELRQQNMISNDNMLQYMNRLADLLFILARYEES